MPKVTVLNDKGDKRDVDESALPYLEKLGWREETTGESFQSANVASRDDYYSGVGQTLKAAGEGFVSGATLGLADPVLDSEQSQFRAEYHPVARTVGEIGGIVAPAVLSGGEGLLAAGSRLTPAGLVSRGAEKVGEGIVKRRVGQLAVAGTLEGVGQATGGLVGSALAGDEVTPEAITHELGMGALFGLGGGIAARGLEMGVNKLRGVVAAADEKAARNAVDELVGEQAPRNPLYDSPAAYQYGKSVKGAVKDADAIIGRKLDEAAHEFESWAGLADDLNAGIPDEAVRTGPLRPAGKGGDTADIRAPKGRATEALDGAGSTTRQVSESQVVSEVGAKSPLSSEAGDLLKKVDEGAVPAMMTNNLKKVAAENGIEVTAEMTPRDVIEALRAKRAAGFAAKGQATEALDFNYADEVGKREEALAGLRGESPDQVVYRGTSEVAPGTPTAKLREPGSFTRKLGAEAEDLAAIAADRTGPLRTVKLRAETAKLPALDDVVKAAEEAGTEELEDVARTMFDGRIPGDNVFGREVARKGKDIMGLIQARSALKDLPDLSLDGLSRMTLDEVTDVAKRLDVIGKYAPDVAAQLDGSMRDALGKAAPGLKDFEALDVLGYHKVSEDAVAKLAEVHDASKNVVALWSTLKAMEGQAGRAVGKSVVKGAMEAGKAAAETKGILTKAAVRGAAKKAVGAMLGGAAAGPVGYVAGWAAAELLLGGGKAASGVAKTITAAKRRALLGAAKGLKALTGPGRPAAIAHMATRDKLAAPISLADTTHEETRNPQELVARRIEQAAFAASSAGRERLADVLTPLRAKSPDLAAAMETDARRRAEYLARYAPRKPAWAAQMGDQWQYPQDQIDRFASVYRAVTQPVSVLEDFGSGTLTPDAAAAWRETSPGMYKMVAQFVMEHFDPSEASYAERFNVSLLLGAPMDPTMHMIPSLQGDFARQSPQGTSLGGGFNGGSTEETAAQRATER